MLALLTYPTLGMGCVFTKIADFNTLIPGGTGSFTAFGGFAPVPAIRSGKVAFVGDGVSGQRGAYFASLDGSLTRLADRNTPNPFGGGTFTDFGPVTCSFLGDLPLRMFGSAGYMGIFFVSAQGQTRVADTLTAIPGGVGNFVGLSMSFSADGPNLAFCGQNSSGHLGVYTNRTGTLSVIADDNTPIPGHAETFTNIGNFEDIDGQEIAFAGFGASGYGGIFTTADGLHAVVDTNTPIPGGLGNFANFGSMSFNSGNLAFKALDAQGHQGIFTNIGGLNVVANTNTPIPGGSGNFTRFGFGLFTGPSLQGNNVAFLGSDASEQEGIYIKKGGSLHKIIAPGDTLDGKTVQVVLMSPDSLDGDRLAFEAFFTDGSAGIFVANTVMAVPAQPLNISTRLRVETGDRMMIGGFIITGNVPKIVAIRGLGPSMNEFGLSDFLADPTLELRGNDGALLAQNDDWQDDPDQAGQLTAFGLAPQNLKESGIVAALEPGAYTALMAGKNQTTGPGLVEIYDGNADAASQLANLSTRGFVQTANSVMIGGFILGHGGGSADVAVRGQGPSLSQFGLNNVLADPILELRDANGALLTTNDNWQDDPISAAQLTSRGLALPNPLESGIFAALAPGAFTAILAGKDGGTGIGLVEIYNGN